MFSPTRRESVQRGTNSRHNSPLAAGGRGSPKTLTVTKKVPATTRERSVSTRARSVSGTPKPVGRKDGHSDKLPLDVYARFEEFEVSFHGFFPPELDFLRNADFFREEYSAIIDSDTGHALLITPTHAYAWRYSSASPSTAYIFPCPLQSREDSTLGVFVPYAAREPGLLLLSTSGNIQFWDSVLAGLTGAERHYSAQVHLAANESVNGIFRCQSSSYIITTTAGRSQRLRLTVTLGTWNIVIAPFTHGFSVLDRVSSLFGSSGPSRPNEAIAAIAFGQNSDILADVWFLLDASVQRWSVIKDGGEKLSFSDKGIIDAIAQGLTNFLGIVLERASDVDIELIDISVLQSDVIVILTGYIDRVDEGNVTQRSHALAKLEITGERLSLIHLQALPQRNFEFLGKTSPCKLLVLKGRLALVHYGDAVVMTALDYKYNVVLPLKSRMDRFLTIAKSNGASGTNEQLIAVTGTGLMSFKIDVDSIIAEDPAAREANLLKNVLTQTLIYGALPYNPLQFVLPSAIDEVSLNDNAIQLSRRVLSSELSVAPGLDMHTNLTDRLAKIHFMMDFIIQNGAISKLTNDTRIRLANDAEKLYAAGQLWKWFNQRSHLLKSTILEEGIRSYFETIGSSDDDDLVRSFFRTKITDLSELLAHISQVATFRERGTVEERSPSIVEANDIVIIIVQEAFQHRQQFRSSYDINHEVPMSVCSWTADPSFISVLDKHFNLTVSTFGEEEHELGDAEKRMDSITPTQSLRQQLGDFAYYLFSCNIQRQKWIQMQGGNSHAVEMFEDKYKRRRTKMLHILAQYGEPERAFELAEDFGDFWNLVRLSQNGRPDRLEKARQYIERYGEAFSAELYRYYIESQNISPLFHQDAQHFALLEHFFAEHHLPRIAWLHELTARKFGDVAELLLEASKMEDSLSAKQVMLSMGLLSQYAQVAKVTSKGDPTNMTTEAFDVPLDCLNVQQELQTQFDRTIAREGPGRHLGIESKTTYLVTTCYSRMQNRPAMLNLLKRNVRRIMEGKALKLSELIETMCSRDKIEKGTGFEVAISLLHSSQEVTEHEKTIFRQTIWRKLYLLDDWERLQQTAGLTDEQIKDNLRGTALYKTLQGLHEHNLGETMVALEQASIPPSTSDMRHRWPKMSDEQLSDLASDYEKERVGLQGIGLESLLEQVVQLEWQDWGERI